MKRESYEELVKRSRLSDMLGVHGGETGFVAASGPSLRHVPRDLAESHPVICVNSSVQWFSGNPYYFTCDGRVVFKKHWQDLRYRESKIICLADVTGTWIHRWGGIEDTDRLFLFDRTASSTMERDADKLIIGSCSTHCAVHMAYVMGFDPIVLLGVDCCYEDGKKYYNDFPGTPDDGYYIPVGPKHIVTPDGKSDDHLKKFDSTWAELAKKNPHVNVINASGGVLDAFPRVSIEELIE